MWDRLGLVEPFSFLLRSSFGLLWFRSHSNSQSKQAIVLVKLWAVAAVAGVASLHAPGAANKNFIGIVEVNNELPINPRPICGSTRLAFPGSFILALAQFVKPVPPLPLLLPICWSGARATRPLRPSLLAPRFSPYRQQKKG